MALVRRVLVFIVTAGILTYGAYLVSRFFPVRSSSLALSARVQCVDGQSAALESPKENANQLLFVGCGGFLP